MANLYITFIVYLIAACFYIVADYKNRIKAKFNLRIVLCISYLCFAIFAFLLNRVDGKLVALTHFKWIFAGMVFIFMGDLILVKKQIDKNFAIGQTAYFISQVLFTVYFFIILFQATGQMINLREVLIFLGSLIILLLIVGINNGLHMGLLFLLVTSAVMIAKGSSLIQFMNTSFSWPLFIGVLLLSFSNAILLYVHHTKKEYAFSKGLYNVLHMVGIIVMPLGIYFV